MFRKIATCIAVASLFYWAPSIVPIKRVQVAIAGCGILTSLPMDSAFAAALPCPIASSGPTPVVVIGAIAGTLSVMINAAIVWNTQCRELTAGEALTAMTLPGLGIALNSNVANQCPGH